MGERRGRVRGAGVDDARVVRMEVVFGGGVQEDVEMG